MTTEPVSEETGKKRSPALLIIGIAVVLLVIAAVAVVAVTNAASQQRRDSLSLLKEDHLTELVDARTKLQPAANAYLAAYKEARNAPGSQEEAEKNSTKEREEFHQAADSARTALTNLQSGHDSADDGLGVAVTHLGDSYQDYINYMEGLVDSYPQFEGLFRKDGPGCDGLFVGSKAESLRERQTLLGQAAAPCKEAANQLKQSKNVAYVEFARTFNNKVEQLESHAETTAVSEENYQEFVQLKDQLVQKTDDATARNASDEELLKIADEAKVLNTRIKNNRSEFDFAAKRYLAGVKEMPTLVEEVFSKDMAAGVKHYDSVLSLRVQVLKDAIDAELAE